jgi:nitroimidazol reductase NimA-like FMN-containing flavoprotein (pyridoxamine 5'-phosphate oxidase superfamily)
MRRKDREMPREFAEGVIDRCGYAVLATVNRDGTPYCIPLSMVREGEWLYFHCAREGQKLDNLRYRNRVCVTCVGDTRSPPGQFTVAYSSAVIFGTAEELTGDPEKIHALRLICERYTPDNMAAFEEAIGRALEATAIWKIRIETITGKGNAAGS